MAPQNENTTALLADYVTREQLAEELKVTTRTLDKWEWLRVGPRKIKLGARVYYKRADVTAWLEAGGPRAAKAAA